MLDENAREETEKGTDYLIEVETLPDNTNANAGDVPNFPPETVKDFPGTITAEISQNLRQKLLKLNAQQKVRLALLANRATRSGNGGVKGRRGRSKRVTPGLLI